MEKLQQVVNLVGNNDVALKCLASGQWRTSRAGLINFTACQTSSLFIKTSSCLNFSNANCYRTIQHCLSFITRSVISIWNETPRRQRGHAPQGLAKIYKLLLSFFFLQVLRSLVWLQSEPRCVLPSFGLFWKEAPGINLLLTRRKKKQQQQEVNNGQSWKRRGLTERTRRLENNNSKGRKRKKIIPASKVNTSTIYLACWSERHQVPHLFPFLLLLSSIIHLGGGKKKIKMC